MPGGKNTTYTPEQWRVWKRNQRNPSLSGRCTRCGNPTADNAHTGSSLSSSTQRLCRSCHVRADNLAGLHKRS